MVGSDLILVLKSDLCFKHFNSLGRGNSLILGSLPSLVMLQVRAEWTQMSCLSRGKSFIMADMGGRDGHGEKV